MEDKITLDRESFKSLASETRVSILKSLDRRRKTLTELSKEFGMSPSTVKEHMDNLCGAGLTEQIDEGHKWKYYELTMKGKNVLHPEYTKIWILLSVSALAIVGIFYDLWRMGSGAVQFAGSAAPLLGNADKIAEVPSDAGGQAVSQIAAEALPQSIPYLHIIGILLFAVLLGSCMTYIFLRRNSVRV
ncbi:MAG: winged helix-turn-helix transcriptional regulator [Candidatus Aenigmarchaeota archaeon]|nr:winged helix-turn-helix transcriptional regulator [Candidatus Aenigmarchaeota archaeon]